MAITTTDILVRNTDGWKLVATAPAGPVTLKPHSTGRTWFMAIAAALPDDSLRGMPMGRFSGSGEDNSFRSDADIAENIYIRVPPSSAGSADAVDNGLYFSIIKG